MRQALGTAVFAGMLGVTLFGLVFTPVFYVAIRGAVERLERPEGARAHPFARNRGRVMNLPTFGVWYLTTSGNPCLGRFPTANSIEEALEEIVLAGAVRATADCWTSEHHFVDDGYLPSHMAIPRGHRWAHPAHQDRSRTSCCFRSTILCA